MPNKSEEKRIKSGMRKIIDYCLEITVRLVKLSDDKNDILKIASGFIYENQGEYYIVSAGHALNTPGWVIETNAVIESRNETVCIPINFSWNIKQLDTKSGTIKDIDFAWAKLDIESFKKEIKKYKKGISEDVILPVYHESLDNHLIINEAYSYASWNRVTLIKDFGMLERDFSYELGMEYLPNKSNNDLCTFKLSRAHQGHDYYNGASGAPIFNPLGRIDSILLGGCDQNNELWGLNLSKFSQLIGLDID